MKTTKGNMDTMNATSSANLRRAADLQDQIEQMQAELNGLLLGKQVAPGATVITTRTGLKRHFTQESRDKIAAGQRKRWRKQHAEQAAAKAAAAGNPPTALAPPVPQGTPTSGTSLAPQALAAAA